MRGCYCPIKNWKSKVKDIINKIEHNRWIARVMMYKKLVLFCQCISGNMWPWWVFTQMHPGYINYCKTLFRLMCGEHGLNTNTCLWNVRNKSTICQLCDLYIAENVPHILFECSYILEELSSVWNSTRIVAPSALVQNMVAMTPNELTCFWLSGFRCAYIPEWEELYCVVSRYIHDTYRNRMSVKELSVIS